MDKNRIPYALIRFHGYIILADRYLHELSPDGTTKNGELLDMTTTELTKLHDFRLKWTSDDPLHPGIFDLHKNGITKTEVTRAGVQGFMKEFRVFFRPVLERIAVSRNINPNARLALRIAEPVTTRTRHKTGIEESCIIGDIPIGGGMMRFICKTTHESGRASLPALANGVEFAYGIHIPVFDEKGRNITENALSFGECKNIFISSKAGFILEFGIENTCKFVIIFARWINYKHPTLAGLWTGPRRLVIS
jgi:hypothetical protein